MARTIPMPSKEELPDGPRRAFVTELRRYYRAAGRPALRKISHEIERHPDPGAREITASAETIRRMITGKVLPAERDRVHAVFRVLCQMSDIDPDAPRWDDYYDNRETPETNWQHLQRLWDTALEEQADTPPFPMPTPPPPPPTRTTFGDSGPWASDNSTSNYSDEPPF